MDQQLMALANSVYPNMPLYLPLCVLEHTPYQIELFKSPGFCWFFLQDIIDYKIQILICISSIVKDTEDHELGLGTPFRCLSSFPYCHLTKSSEIFWELVLFTTENTTLFWWNVCIIFLFFSFFGGEECSDFFVFVRLENQP